MCHLILQVTHLLVVRGVIKFDSLAQFFPDSDSHERSLTQIAQISKCIVVLGDHIEEHSGAYRTDRII